MIAFTALALQVFDPGPPPPPAPAPVRIEVSHLYELACTVTPRDGAPFALRVSVKGKGKKRHASIASGAPGRFPSGRARSRGAFANSPTRPERYREAFELAGPGGTYSINIRWWDGQLSEVGTSLFQGMGKPFGYPGRAVCSKIAKPSKG